jgi:hypothetical protein
MSTAAAVQPVDAAATAGEPNNKLLRDVVTKSCAQPRDALLRPIKLTICGRQL